MLWRDVKNAISMVLITTVISPTAMLTPTIPSLVNMMMMKERKKKMARCADSNCGYYWQEPGEAYPRCHYNDPWPAPCEYDDEREEEKYEEEYPELEL